ncbi:hypothetical protein [Micromonospora sp. NPDC005806]|uniref:hypothetical protein n=1 Tax=Micromonospora sp. NPDC005806 TaxID=3364234 RepID=UPI0036914133
MTDSGGSRRRRSRRRRRARVRRALLTGLVVVSLLLTTGGWVGFRGWQTRTHLLNAAGLAKELSTEVVGGDAGRAQRTLAALQEQAGAARRATGDPGWWLGQRAPYAGNDLTAMRQIAVAVDDLTRLAFPTLLRLDLASLVPSRGASTWPGCAPSPPRSRPPTGRSGRPPRGSRPCRPTTSSGRCGRRSSGCVPSSTGSVT